MNETPGVPELLEELGRIQGRETSSAGEGPARRVLGVWLGTELYGLVARSRVDLVPRDNLA